MLQNPTSFALEPGNPFPPCEFLLCSVSEEWDHCEPKASFARFKWLYKQIEVQDGRSEAWMKTSHCHFSGYIVYNSALSDELGHSLFFFSCCSRCKGQIGPVNNKHGCFPSLSSLAACFLCVSLKYSWIPCIQLCKTRTPFETESCHVNMKMGMHLYKTCM